MNKPSRSVTTTIQLLLEIKVKKKKEELSKYVWELKNNNIYDFRCSVACKTHTQLVLENVNSV